MEIIDAVNKKMKIYVCYTLGEGENGKFDHKVPSIAFTDKPDVERWLRPFGTYAGYDEIDLVFGKEWILPFKMGEGT